MRRLTSPRLERWGLIALVAGLPLSLSFSIFGAEPATAPVVSAVLIGGGLVFAILVVRGLPRLILIGVLAGAFAGLLAGGFGGRIAMRVVSIMGGRREITLGGSVSLLAFMTVPAGVFGIVLSALRRLKTVPSWMMGVATMMAPGLPILMGDDIAREELLHEGQAWFNFPAFFGLFFLYGYLAHRAMEWLDARIPKRRKAEPLKA